MISENRNLAPLELRFWLIASIGCALTYTLIAGGPLLQNDSYQYLSLAENIAQGNGLQTSIIHFDIERAHGTVPAPLTTFPPGYGISIAALSRLGIEHVTAGLLLGLGSLGSLILFIVATGRLFDFNIWTTRLLIIFLLANSFILVYSISLMSEALFTALSCGSLYFILRHEASASTHHTSTPETELSFLERFWSLLLGNLLIGLAFSIRYAGFFLFTTTLVFYGARLILKRDRNAVLSLACTGVSFFLVALIFARNFLLTETLTGGNEKIVNNPILTTLKAALASFHHLFLGDTIETQLGFWEIILASSAGLLILIALWAWNRNLWLKQKDAPTPSGYWAGVTLLVSYAFIYSIGMIYLGLTTVISFGPRMFYPLMPVLLILGGIFFDPIASAQRRGSPIQPRILLIVMSAMVFSYSAINVRALSVEIPQSPHMKIAQLWDKPLSTGPSLRTWIDEYAPPDAVIVSTNGQATAYALRRRTLSLVSTDFSTINWDEARIRDAMRIFKSDLLILYSGTEVAALRVQNESDFLTDLLAGTTPSWLTMVAKNDNVKIFSSRPSMLNAQESVLPARQSVRSD